MLLAVLQNNLVAVTITSITPSSGVTGGKGLVLIIGTGFDGLTNKMTVTFDGVAATRPRVLDGNTTSDGTLLDCIVPLCPLTGPGTVDVKVTNDSTTVSVTKADGYEYKRPDKSVRSHLMLVWAALVERIRLEVLEETVMASASRDYARPGGAGAAKAKVPAIILETPNLVENGEQTYHNEVDTGNIPGLTFERQRETLRYDLEFDIVVLDRPDIAGGGGLDRGLTLVKWVMDFFNRTPELIVARLAAAPTDTVSYLMRLETAPQPEKIDDDPGLLAWRGVCVVEAVGIEVGDSIETGVLFGADTKPEVTVDTVVPGETVLKPI